MSSGFIREISFACCQFRVILLSTREGHRVVSTNHGCRRVDRKETEQCYYSARMSHGGEVHWYYVESEVDLLLMCDLPTGTAEWLNCGPWSTRGIFIWTPVVMDRKGHDPWGTLYTAEKYGSSFTFSSRHYTVCTIPSYCTNPGAKRHFIYVCRMSSPHGLNLARETERHGSRNLCGCVAERIVFHTTVVSAVWTMSTPILVGFRSELKAGSIFVVTMLSEMSDPRQSGPITSQFSLFSS